MNVWSGVINVWSIYDEEVMKKLFCIISHAGSSFMNVLVLMKLLWFEIRESWSCCLAEGLHIYSPVATEGAAGSQRCEWYDNFSLFIYNVAIILLFITADVGLIGFVFLLIKAGVEEQNWWIFYESLLYLAFFFFLFNSLALFSDAAFPSTVRCNRKLLFYTYYSPL